MRSLGFVPSAKALPDDAEVFRHVPGLYEEVRDVAPTTPPPLGGAAIDAGRVAGVEVSRLINEPTAAALAHGLHQNTALKRIAVLDLGGGTFDVTILERFEGVGDVRASVGDVHLGGEDVTDAILRWMAQRSPARTWSAAADARLRHRAESAKRALSTSDVAEVELEGGAARLDRAELEALCAPFSGDGHPARLCAAGVGDPDPGCGPDGRSSRAGRRGRARPVPKVRRVLADLPIDVNTPEAVDTGSPRRQTSRRCCP